MSKITTLQHFRNIAELKEYFGVILPKPHDWRLLNPEVGSIHGLPRSQGVAQATNGILVAIQQDKKLFIGHIASWTADEEQPVKLVTAKKVSASKPRQPKFDISDFI